MNKAECPGWEKNLADLVKTLESHSSAHILIKEAALFVDKEPDAVRRLLIRIAIVQAMSAHSHAFDRGCGRETMLHWICKTEMGEAIKRLKIPMTAGDVRQDLMSFVANGSLTKRQSVSGHSIFEAPIDNDH